MKKTARNIYLALILILMYAPIVTLMILSFNASKSRSKWGGFTLKWYGSLFRDDAIMSALYNTLVIAFFICNTGNFDRNLRLYRHQFHEEQVAHSFHGCD